MWAVTHFHAYLYGNDFTIYTDHFAVKAVLETPNPSSKHARWWSKVYDSGVRSVNIIYKPGRENLNAGALSRNPTSPPPQEHMKEIQVVQVSAVQPVTDEDISTLLHSEPISTSSAELGPAQRRDPEFRDLMIYLTTNNLPADPTQARR